MPDLAPGAAIWQDIAEYTSFRELGSKQHMSGRAMIGFIFLEKCAISEI